MEAPIKIEIENKPHPSLIFNRTTQNVLLTDQQIVLVLKGLPSFQTSP